jgi:hypothetical protein
MVERYTKARPFEERRRAPSPFTAARKSGIKREGLQKCGHHRREAAWRSWDSNP